jgi:predicted DCC family thiol-disulfide oxidoreductase YuxK
MIKKTIYYDGSCAACSNIMLRIDRSEKRDNFVKVDLNSGSIPKGLTKEILSKEIHVVDNKGVMHRNYNALLVILEEYPKLKTFVAIGRSPFIYQIGVIGYKLFAANRHFILGIMSRILWTKILVASGFLASLIITSKLWMTDRTYPLVPVIPNIPKLPLFLDNYVFATLIILLLVIIFIHKPNKSIFLFSGVFFLLVIFDINRLQIFYYQYIFMLLALGLFSWDFNDKTQAKAVLNTCRLVIVCVYFWSGMQKLNIYFLLGTFPWFVEPIIRQLPESFRQIAIIFGIFVPFFEIGTGIGLLINKTRPYAILGVIAMHIFILYSLGPFGHNWAPSVWPWNIVMMLLVVVLFWKTNDSLQDILWVRNFSFQKIILILFGIMPLFSFFNAWDSYLSFTMYSGNTNSAFMIFAYHSRNSLPHDINQYVITNENRYPTLNLSLWAYDEFNVLPYPETNVYKAVARDVCQYVKDKKNVKLVILGKRTIFNPDKTTTYSCVAL